MYRIHPFIGVIGIIIALLLGGCDSDPISSPVDSEEAVRTEGLVTAKSNHRGAHPGPMIWANGELFRSIVTPATFRGDQGNFDALYVITPHTFAGPYDHLSDAAPGDQDYNGGRWEVFNLKSSVSPSKYDNVSSTSDSNFDHADWWSTGVYFECPMLPNRGQGQP